MARRAGSPPGSRGARQLPSELCPATQGETQEGGERRITEARPVSNPTRGRMALRKSRWRPATPAADHADDAEMRARGTVRGRPLGTSLPHAISPKLENSGPKLRVGGRKRSPNTAAGEAPKPKGNPPRQTRSHQTGAGPEKRRDQTGRTGPNKPKSGEQAGANPNPRGEQERTHLGSPRFPPSFLRFIPSGAQPAADVSSRSLRKRVTQSRPTRLALTTWSGRSG